jgi:hypothetical protein
VTESDARITKFSTPELQSEAEHQADLRALALQKQVRDKALVYMFGAPELLEPVKPVRETWPGKDWELAAKIENDLTQARGRAPTPAELTEGYKQASEQYEKKNNRGRFTPKGLRDVLKVHRQWVKEHSYPHPRVTKISPR